MKNLFINSLTVLGIAFAVSTSALAETKTAQEMVQVQMPDGQVVSLPKNPTPKQIGQIKTLAYCAKESQKFHDSTYAYIRDNVDEFSKFEKDCFTEEQIAAVNRDVFNKLSETIDKANQAYAAGYLKGTQFIDNVVQKALPPPPSPPLNLNCTTDYFKGSAVTHCN
jgi:hypothetical protein